MKNVSKEGFCRDTGFIESELVYRFFDNFIIAAREHFSFSSLEKTNREVLEDLYRQCLGQMQGEHHVTQLSFKVAKEIIEGTHLSCVLLKKEELIYLERITGTFYSLSLIRDESSGKFEEECAAQLYVYRGWTLLQLARANFDVRLSHIIASTYNVCLFEIEQAYHRWLKRLTKDYSGSGLQIDKINIIDYEKSSIRDRLKQLIPLLKEHIEYGISFGCKSYEENARQSTKDCSDYFFNAFQDLIILKESNYELSDWEVISLQYGNLKSYTELFVRIEDIVKKVIDICHLFSIDESQSVDILSKKKVDSLRELKECIKKISYVIDDSEEKNCQEQARELIKKFSISLHKAGMDGLSQSFERHERRINEKHNILPQKNRLLGSVSAFFKGCEAYFIKLNIERQEKRVFVKLPEFPEQFSGNEEKELSEGPLALFKKHEFTEQESFLHCRCMVARNALILEVLRARGMILDFIPRYSKHKTTEWAQKIIGLQELSEQNDKIERLYKECSRISHPDRRMNHSDVFNELINYYYKEIPGLVGDWRRHYRMEPLIDSHEDDSHQKHHCSFVELKIEDFKNRRDEFFIECEDVQERLKIWEDKLKKSRKLLGLREEARNLKKTLSEDREHIIKLQREEEQNKKLIEEIARETEELKQREEELLDVKHRDNLISPDP